MAAPGNASSSATSSAVLTFMCLRVAHSLCAMYLLSTAGLLTEYLYLLTELVGIYTPDSNCELDFYGYKSAVYIYI
jgi:hypothetical protein